MAQKPETLELHKLLSNYIGPHSPNLERIAELAKDQGAVNEKLGNETALRKALSGKNWNAANQLITSGAEVIDWKSEDYASIALANGASQITQGMICKNGHQIPKNDNGEFVIKGLEGQLKENLVSAAARGNVAEIDYIVGAGISADSQAPEKDINGRRTAPITPLIAAIKHGQPETRDRLLFTHNANPRAASSVGLTPEAMAVLHEDLESLGQLQQAIFSRNPELETLMRQSSLETDMDTASKTEGEEIPDFTSALGDEKLICPASVALGIGSREAVQILAGSGNQVAQGIIQMDLFGELSTGGPSVGM